MTERKTCANCRYGYHDPHDAKRCRYMQVYVEWGVVIHDGEHVTLYRRDYLPQKQAVISWEICGRRRNKWRDKNSKGR